MRFIWLAALILHSNLAFAVGPNARRSAAVVNQENSALKAAAAKAFPQKKVSVADLIKGLKQDGAPANYVKELEERGKEVMNETMEFEFLGPSKYVLRSQGNEVVVEVMNLAEGHFKVNNKPTTIDFRQKPADLWMSIEKLLQKKTAAANPMMALFLPEAQAFWGIATVLGLGLFAFGLYKYNSSNCDSYKQLVARCAPVLSTPPAQNLTPQFMSSLLADAQKLHDSWLTIAWGCSDDKTKVKQCISTLQNGVPYQPTCGGSTGVLCGSQQTIPQGYKGTN